MPNVREKHPDSFGARFGKLVYKCRGEQGLSQESLALTIYKSEARKGDVADLENGYVRKPQARTIALYADALDIPPVDIAACHEAPTGQGGYTRAEHEARLDRKEENLRIELERAGRDRGKLEQQLAEVQRRHADIEADYARAQKELEETHATLTRFQNSLGREKTDAATRALDRGDTTLANALFEEAKAALLAEARDTQQAAADLAYRQAQIADEDLRWQDAERLLTEAATLAATNVWYWIRCGRMRRRLGLSSSAVDAVRTARSLAEAEGQERGIAVSSNDLGDLLVIEGQYAEAELLYKKAFKIARSVSIDNAEAMHDLSISLNKVGDAAIMRGDHAAATEAYGESLEFRRQLSTQFDTPDILRDLSISLNKIGDAARMRCDDEAAAKAFNESLEIRRRLNIELGTPDALRDLVISLNRIVALGIATNDLLIARAHYDEAQTLIPTLHPLDIEDARAAFAALAPRLDP